MRFQVRTRSLLSYWVYVCVVFWSAEGVLGCVGVTLPHGMVKVGMDTDSGDNVSAKRAVSLTIIA